HTRFSRDWSSDVCSSDLAQMLALIPGVSRSGATTTAGLALGYNRPTAARFAFLLAVPAVFGSGLYELFHRFSEPVGAYGYAETRSEERRVGTVGNSRPKR